MRKLLLSFLVLSFINVYSQAEIVGGEDCDISEYPWQAAIYADGYLCGASVIHQYWVITAAHCVEEGNQVFDAESITVGVGSSNEYAGLFSAGGDEYEVAEVISHPNYGGNGNDIALLRTKQPIEFSNDVHVLNDTCSKLVFFFFKIIRFFLLFNNSSAFFSNLGAINISKNNLLIC